MAINTECRENCEAHKQLQRRTKSEVVVPGDVHVQVKAIVVVRLGRTAVGWRGRATSSFKANPYTHKCNWRRRQRQLRCWSNKTYRVVAREEGGQPTAHYKREPLEYTNAWSETKRPSSPARVSPTKGARYRYNVGKRENRVHKSKAVKNITSPYPREELAEGGCTDLMCCRLWC